MTVVENIYSSAVPREHRLPTFVLHDTPALQSALNTNLQSSLSSKAVNSLISQRLNTIAQRANIVPFDDTSRFVFFSDCHRGDLSSGDVFAANEQLFLKTLAHYYHSGYTYCEVGDGDELWQNRRFCDILRAHSAAFDMLHRFHHQNRLHIIAGNHDVAVPGQKSISKDGMRAENGITLQHKRTGQRILVTHGHQADISSDRLSPVSRLVVRYIWRYIHDWPITDSFRNMLRREVNLKGLSRAKATARLLSTIEKRLINWVNDSRQMLICGHTHRACAATPGAPPYFNTGSFVTPGEATGLEIQGGDISLVRWRAHPVTGEISREVLTSPRHLAAYT